MSLLPESRPRANASARALALSFALLCILLASPIRAHRIESSLTTIDHNVRTGLLEVIHEIYHHDLEHVVGKNRGEIVDLTTDSKALKEAVDWIGQQFRLADSSERTLQLRCVGAEIERGRLLIYSEVEAPEGLDTLRVYDQMLMESIPRQVNRVNIRIGGPTETLIFRRGDGWQELSLPTSD